MVQLNKELMRYVIVITIGVIFWYLLGLLYLKVLDALVHISFPQYDIYRALLGLVLTLIGILIEWQTLLKILSHGRTIRIGLLIFAIFLINFPLIPQAIILNNLGFSSLNDVKGIISLMYESAYSRSATSILGGVLLVRSFKKTETS